MFVDIQRKIVSLPMDEVFADIDFNCRGNIIPLHVKELANNIAVNGLIQPIIVQPYEYKTRVNGELKEYKYRIIAGYRRFKAHELNNAQTIDCEIRYGLSEIDARTLNLSENLEREDLNMMQEARVLQSLKKSGLDNKQIAKKLNKSITWVKYHFDALALPKDIQEEVESGLLTVEHVIKLSSFRNDPERQYDLVQAIKANAAKGGKTLRLKSIKALKRDPNIPMVRDKKQIENLMDYIIESLGYNTLCTVEFATQIGAWVAGNITTNDIYLAMYKIAEEENILFTIPDEDVSPI